MFNATLGKCNTTPVYLELNDDINAVCSLPYAVLRVHEDMFIKEVKKPVSLGAL